MASSYRNGNSSSHTELKIKKNNKNSNKKPNERPIHEDFIYIVLSLLLLFTFFSLLRLLLLFRDPFLAVYLFIYNFIYLFFRCKNFFDGAAHARTCDAPLLVSAAFGFFSQEKSRDGQPAFMFYNRFSQETFSSGAKKRKKISIGSQ